MRSGLCQPCLAGNHAGCVTGDNVGFHCSCARCRVDRFNRLAEAKNPAVSEKLKWKPRRKKH